MKAALRLTLSVAFAAAGVTVHIPVFAAPITPARAGTPLYVQGEVLVKFKPSSDMQERKVITAARGHAILETLNQPGWVRLKIGDGQTVESALSAYRNDRGVEYAQPNYLYHASAVPDDTQYDQLWAFKNTGQTVTRGDFKPITGTSGADMHIEGAWDHITDCSNIVVAVIDTGVNYKHEELATNMWNGGPDYPNHGWNFIENTPDPMDLNGHGTHVAGIIGAAGNNARGTAGVCWKSRIMAVRVLDVTGSGTTAQIIQGIDFAVANHAKVINMSLGYTGPLDEALSDAISNALQGDVVVVVAAGNATQDNDVTQNFPCDFTQPNLICVAALDQNYALASFSNWGAGTVHVGAPGTNILSSYAGTVATTKDPLTAWAISGGWVLQKGSSYYLADPAHFLHVKYAPNLMDTATKGFNLADADAATVSFFASVNLPAGGSSTSGDRFVFGVDPGGTDPFSGAHAYQLVTAGPLDDGINFYHASVDISSCAGKPNCLIGFELATGPETSGDYGIGIASFSIDTLTLNADTYEIENGTSMASPEVAGLAAMLRAYNPQFTYADTVNAIEVGGRPIPALAGKTTTGNAVDVTSSLAFIKPPTGLTADVQ